MLPEVSQEPIPCGRAALSDTIPSEFVAVDLDFAGTRHDENRQVLHHLLTEVVGNQLRMTHQLENWVLDLSRKLDSLREMQLHAGLWKDEDIRAWRSFERPSERGVRSRPVDNRTTAIATDVEEVVIHMDSNVSRNSHNCSSELQSNGFKKPDRGLTLDGERSPCSSNASAQSFSTCPTAYKTESCEAATNETAYKSESWEVATKETESGEASFASVSGSPVSPTASAHSKSSMSVLCLCQQKCHHVVVSTYFEMFFGMLILSNSVFLGIQVEWLAENWDNSSNYPYYHDAIAHVFFVAFLAELLLRVFANGWHFFYSGSWAWNWFDFIIVALSVVELMLIQFYDHSLGFCIPRMIRCARVVRNLRVVRLVRNFRQLGKLVAAIEHSMKECVWAVVLFVLVLYVYGIVFAQAVADRAERLGGHTPSELGILFGSLPGTMFTLFKSITGGMDWHRVVVALAHVGGFHVVLFVIFICFMYFVLLNVITGMFCQSAFQSVRITEEEEIEMQMAKDDDYVRKLNVLFGEIDTCGAMYITYEQFEEKLNDPRVDAFFKSLGIDTDDALGIFELLDVSGEGHLDIHEFVHGCLEIQGAAKNIHIHRMIFENRYMRLQIDRLIKMMKRQFPEADERTWSVAPSVNAVRSKLSGKVQKTTSGLLPQQRRSFFRKMRSSSLNISV